MSKRSALAQVGASTPKTLNMIGDLPTNNGNFAGPFLAHRSHPKTTSSFPVTLRRNPLAPSGCVQFATTPLQHTYADRVDQKDIPYVQTYILHV
jgi:hypothetical protein